MRKREIIEDNKGLLLLGTKEEEKVYRERYENKGNTLMRQHRSKEIKNTLDRLQLLAANRVSSPFVRHCTPAESASLHEDNPEDCKY